MFLGVLCVKQWLDRGVQRQFPVRNSLPQENLAHGLSLAQEGLLAEPRDAGEHVTAGWLVCAAGAGERQWKVFKAALKV